jgi:hypothetical protein
MRIFAAISTLFSTKFPYKPLISKNLQALTFASGETFGNFALSLQSSHQNIVNK